MPGPETPPPAQPIGSRAEFVAALHAALAQALQRRARSMVWVDADFAGWPLDDPAWLRTLTEWIRLPARQLVLVGHSFDHVVRRRSRFNTWHRLWSHAVFGCVPQEGVDDELPCLLVVQGGPTVRLVDAERWRGHSEADPAVARLWGERVDALLQRCVPALPATTLGL